MRFRFRYSLTTLLLMPLLVGIGIKWYRGPHQYTLAEEREWLRAEDKKDGFVALCDGFELFEDGTFWAYRNFDGSIMRHGPEEWVSSDGSKNLVEYRNGRLHGEHRTWDSNGELLEAGQYANHQPVGEWLCYEQGRIFARVEHQEDRTISRDGQGRIFARVDYKKDRTIHRDFDEAGRLIRERIDFSSRIEELVREWHPNGQKRFEGQFSLAAEHGTWRWWDESGGEIRCLKLSQGVPEEVTESRLRNFIDWNTFPCDFQGVELAHAIVAVNSYGEGDYGYEFRIDGPDSDLVQVRERLITTAPQLNGPLAFYVALRDAGFIMRIDVEESATGIKEVLFISPVEAD